MNYNFPGPSFIRDKIRAAGSIQLEPLEALYGIDRIINQRNLRRRSNSTKNLQIYIYSIAKKKTEALYRTISPMSHNIEILLRIITKRVKNEINPEIVHEQCDFESENGTCFVHPSNYN